MRIPLRIVFVFMIAVISVHAYAADNVDRFILPLRAPDFIYDSVVVVVCDDSYGTGWWVGQDIIVTASHVVNWGQGCSDLRVLRAPWSSTAEIIVATDRQHGDVAVLRVHNPKPGHPVLPLAATEPKRPPFAAYIVGYPLELLRVVGNNMARLSSLPRVYPTIVSWFDPRTHIYEIGRTDAGNSGGPVVSPNGAVVGIVNFALPGAATELFFGSSIYWVKYALRQAGVTWQELQAAEVNPITQDVNVTEQLAWLEQRQKGLEEELYSTFEKMYSIYSMDPKFFVILVATIFGGLSLVVYALRR